MDNISNEKFEKEDFISFLSRKFSEFKKFKSDLLLNQNNDYAITNYSIDFAIIPLIEQEFDIIYYEPTEDVFAALEFRRPGQGEWLWRIPGFFSEKDVDCILENVTQLIEKGIGEDEIDQEILKGIERKTEKKNIKYI